MNRMMKQLSTLACVLIMIALLTGCGKAQDKAADKIVEKAIESDAAAKGEKVKVDIDSDKGTFSMKTNEGTIEVKGDEGSYSMKSDKGSFEMKTGEGAGLPDNFPKDVPVYAGLKIEMSMSMAEQDGFTVSGTTPDSIDKISEFYQKESADKGWKEEMNMKQPDTHMLIYKKEGRVLNVVVSKSDDKTSVSITTAKE